MEEAIDHLRKTGLKTAEKKASRSMGEGRVHALVTDDAKRGSLIAVTCETDFAAGTEDFGSLLSDLATLVLENEPADLEELRARKWSRAPSVELGIKAVIGKLGENISVAEIRRMENPKGYVHAYVHHDGKQGAMVSVTTDAAPEAAAEALKTLCQHVVVFRAPYLSRADVPADLIEREKAIYREEVASKPANIQDKIIAGKLEKFYADNVLTEQPWVMDDKQTVRKALAAALGGAPEIADYARFRIGE
jgi:elongation factor Ts